MSRLKYKRKWWSADIPESWSAKDDRGKVTFDFADDQCAYCIEVNATKKVYGQAEAEDLLSFMSEIEKDCTEKVSFEKSRLEGYLVKMSADSECVWKWFLLHREYIFLISLKSEGAPTASIVEVEQFLHSIKLNCNPTSQP